MRQSKIIEHLHHQKKILFYIYNMSRGAKELTQIRKITVEEYSKNKIHILCIYKKFTEGVYVIQVSIIDLQKCLDLQNLFHLATKKVKSYCNTKYPTKY